MIGKSRPLFLLSIVTALIGGTSHGQDGPSLSHSYEYYFVSKNFYRQPPVTQTIPIGPAHGDNRFDLDLNFSDTADGVTNAFFSANGYAGISDPTFKGGIGFEYEGVLTVPTSLRTELDFINTITYRDTLIVEGDLQAVASFNNFHITAKLDGRMEFDSVSGGGQNVRSYLDTAVSMKTDSATIELNHEFGDNRRGSHLTNRTLTGSYQINDRIDVELGLKTGAYNVMDSGTVRWKMLLGDTFKITSVLLPDGSTPESHGLSLRWESGFASPNAVPELSSLLLLCFASSSFLAQRRTARG